MEGESTNSEEEEERAVRPQVARAPKGSPAKPLGSLPPVEHSVSSLTDLSPPESSSGEEDSNEEEEITYNTGSLTSHTTASSLSSADMKSAEDSHKPIVQQKVSLALSCPIKKILVRHLIVFL